MLLDTVPDARLVREIRQRMEVGVTGWRICICGGGHVGVIAAVVSDTPQAPEAYKARLAGLSDSLSHATVEVHACRHRAAA